MFLLRNNQLDTLYNRLLRTTANQNEVLPPKDRAKRKAMENVAR
jgi:hypothetical protein